MINSAVLRLVDQLSRVAKPGLLNQTELDTLTLKRCVSSSLVLNHLDIHAHSQPRLFREF